MQPGIIGKRSHQPRRNRRRQDSVPVKATPIAISGVDPTGATVTIEFDQPVSLKGVPQYRSNLGTLPTSAVQPAPNAVTLEYPAGSPANITVPFQDPAVRNSTGGYVLAGDYSLA